MERLLFFLLIFFFNQIALSQINLNIDIDARQLKQMKLSDISAKSYFLALKIDSISNFIATDNFLFFSQGNIFSAHKLYQFDLSGKLVRTFNNDKNESFKVDSKNNRIFHRTDNDFSFLDYNGAFLKKIFLSMQELRNNGGTLLGFDKNNIWISYQEWQSEKVVIRICRLNLDNESQETVLEREFPVPQVPFHYKVTHSSLEGKEYISFHDNVIYEINGKNVHPVAKYNIRNYRDEISHVVHQSRFAGRYLTIKYGPTFDNFLLFWYDTKEKQTWQMKINNRIGGIEDDIFHTGTCDNYSIDGDFLVFRKHSNDLPKEMNVEKGHTVIFITKLKQ